MIVRTVRGKRIFPLEDSFVTKKLPYISVIQSNFSSSTLLHGVSK